MTTVPEDQLARAASLLREDLTTRAAYVSDASIYRRLPAAVAEPRTVEQIRDLLALAHERGWSVISRGGGTSVAGNSIGGLHSGGSALYPSLRYQSGGLRPAACTRTRTSPSLTAGFGASS